MQPTKISQGSLQTPSSRFARALERPLRPKVQRSPRSQSSLAPLRRQSASAPHGPPGGTGTVVGSDIGRNIGNTGNIENKDRKMKMFLISKKHQELKKSSTLYRASHDFPLISCHAALGQARRPRLWRGVDERPGRLRGKEGQRHLLRSRLAGRW